MKSQNTPTSAPSVEQLASPLTEDPRGTAVELLRTIAKLEGEIRRHTVTLASAAHELRTPLAIITGYIELLLAGKTGPINERQKGILSEVSANCLRLQRFIGDLLMLGAVESGKLTMRYELTDLSACLSELYALWLLRFQAKRVALYFPAECKLNSFSMDGPKIQHVISNLLENALKFTPAEIGRAHV
jgi:signal transduction histidine kinase